MSKNKMMQGMVGCRLRTIEEGEKKTTVKEEEIDYIHHEQIIIADEESKDGRIAQKVWHKKEVDGKKYRRLYDTTNQEWLTDWILCE